MKKIIVSLVLSLIASVSLAQNPLYKSPYCGCCKLWMKIMMDNDMEFEVKHLEDLTPIKDQLNVPSELRSCHTVELEELIIEGHVPFETIENAQAMSDRNFIGLAVPGMPQGSPGMPGTSRGFDVYAFDAEGNSWVFASF